MGFTLLPELAAVYAQLFAQGAPPPLAVGDIAGRRERLDGMFNFLKTLQAKNLDVSTKDFHVPTADGKEKLLCRWFTKNDHPLSGAAFLYSHGGGMICLGIDHYDEVLKRYVSRTGVPLLAVEYRLAPESPAPGPVHDAYAALQYLVSHAAELGVDANRIGIMGDSGGGTVTAGLAHYVKKMGGPAVQKQILFYPMLDDRTQSASAELAPFLSWTPDDNKTGWGALLGDRLGKDGVPATDVPARMTVDDAKGLPSTYIDTGELDLFRDEDLQYARILGQAGVECELHLFPQVPHAFEHSVPDAAVSRKAVEARCNAMLSI